MPMRFAPSALRSWSTLCALLIPAVALALLAGVSSSTANAAAQKGGKPAGRVVVVGFDGGDFATVSAMSERGELPNFARLKQGTFEPLESTQPAESPTAWASLNTGQNPSKTGVPGFVQRDLWGGLPAPGFGHIAMLEGAEGRPLAELHSTPIPTWDRRTYLILGAVASFLLGAALLLALRVKVLVTVPVALVLGVLGGIGAQTARDWLPERYPVTANPNQQPGFWDTAAGGGLRAVVLNAAQAFDQRHPDNVRLLAGLGVPDARGGLGDWFVYTSTDYRVLEPADGAAGKQGTRTPTAGYEIQVTPRGDRIESRVVGPKDFWREGQLHTQIEALKKELDGPDVGYQASLKINEQLMALEDDLEDLLEQSPRLDVPLVVELRDESALVTIDGTTQELREGEWSDWFRVEFPMNPLLSVHAITRAKLVSLREPHFELFLSRLDLDPAKPAFWQPVSAPIEFSKALAAACGPYETYGWSTLTMPFKDKKITAQTLLEDVEFTLKWRESLVMHAFERGDWDLFMGVFSTTDRTQHMTYAMHDPEHPAHDPAKANELVQFFGEEIPVKDAIPSIYRQADRVLGRILDGLRPNDLLLVVSDHGFQSFRWQVDVNQLLAGLGFLALDPELAAAKPPAGQPIEAGRSSRHGSLLSSYVDWSKTRAYSLGMGAVYLNQIGREGQGIVAPEARQAVLEELRAALLAAKDPRTGDNLVSQVVITKEDRTGPHGDREPDLMIGFASHYGPAWTSRGGGTWLVDTAAGGVEFGPLVEPNDSPWSGDHVGVDTRNVLGLFLSNQRFELPADRPVHVLEIAPTVLDFLGIERPAALDRAPLRRIQ